MPQFELSLWMIWNWLVTSSLDVMYSCRRRLLQMWNMKTLIIYLTVVQDGGLEFYFDSSYNYLSFFRQLQCTLRVQWTELNQKLPRVRKWMRFENVGPKFRVSPFLKIWAQNTYFRRLSTTLQQHKFNDRYLRNKTWYKQSGKRLEIIRDPLQTPKFSCTSIHKWWK